jgi:hypothetical protein
VHVAKQNPANSSYQAKQKHQMSPVFSRGARSKEKSHYMLKMKCKSKDLKMIHAKLRKMQNGRTKTAQYTVEKMIEHRQHA